MVSMIQEKITNFKIEPAVAKTVTDVDYEADSDSDNSDDSSDDDLID